MTGHLLPRSWNWGSLVISHQGILGVIIITSPTCPLEQTIQLLYECVLWNNKWQLQSWHQAATNNFQQHKLTASICLWSYEHAGRSFRGTQPVFLSGILAMKADGVFTLRWWEGRVVHLSFTSKYFDGHLICGARDLPDPNLSFTKSIALSTTTRVARNGRPGWPLISVLCLQFSYALHTS